MVQQSITTVALLHKFVYEFSGNNTYIILDRTALVESRIQDLQVKKDKLTFDDLKMLFGLESK